MSVLSLATVLAMFAAGEAVLSVVYAAPVPTNAVPMEQEQAGTFPDSSLGGNERWSAQFPPVGAVGPIGMMIGGTMLSATEHQGLLYFCGSFGYMDGVACRGLIAWDGNRWIPCADHGISVVYSMLSAGGRLFAGGTPRFSAGDFNCVSMWDGVRWTRIGDGLGARRLPSVVTMTMYHDSLIVGGDLQWAGGRVTPGVAQWTGQGWEPMGSDTLYDDHGYGALVQGLQVYHDTLFAVGSMRYSPGDGIVFAAFWNGRTWIPTRNRPDGTVSEASLYGGELVIGGAFHHVGAVAAGGLAAWNGRRWRELGALSLAGGSRPHVRTLYASGNALYVAGRFNQVNGRQLGGIVVLENGEWRGLNAGPLGSSDVRCMALYSDRLFVGGDIGINNPVWKSQNVAALDARGWGPVDTDFVHLVGAAYGLIGVSDGLLAAGSFATPASERPITAVGLRNDGRWTLRGGAFDQPVLDLAAGQDEIYAVGDFTRIGDQENKHVSVYRSQDENWHPLGSGLSGTARTLAWYGGEMIVGGDFRYAGDLEVHGVAVWNGRTWEALGAGFNGPVTDLVIFRDELYAFGVFSKSGSATCLGCARWDGHQWTPIHEGLTFSYRPGIYGAAVLDDRLFAFGDFETVGGVPSGDLACWNDSAWTSVLPACDGSVTAIGVCDGRLVVGGSFPGASYDRTLMLQYDGTWWRVGDGVWTGTHGWAESPEITSMAQHGEELYVSGNFRAAGNKPSAFIARWSTAAPIQPPRLALRVIPNPVREASVFSWMHSGGPVRIRIFDAEGRVVSSDIVMATGSDSGRTEWRPIEQNGRRLAPGVYFARLEAGGSSASAKVLVIR